MEEHKNETHTFCLSCKQPFWFPNEGLGMTVPCPHCGREVELAPRSQTPSSGKPEMSPVTEAKKPSSTLYFWFACVGLGLILLGYGAWSALKSMQGPKEKTWQEFRVEATPLMINTASNQIVGFRRIRLASVDFHHEAENPNVWTGDVAAEYTNPNGGVSVTNVLYKFGLEFDGVNKLRCTYDYIKSAAEETARNNAKFDAELKALKVPQ